MSENEEFVSERGRVVAGRFVAPGIEASIRRLAAQAGLECRIDRRPRLVSIEFTVTVRGPSEGVVEFTNGMRAWRNWSLYSAVPPPPS
jgi:hypothetical protein